MNVVESPCAMLRLRTDAAKRFKKMERATGVIGKMHMVAQTRFRQLRAPECYAGARYQDGFEVTEKDVAA